MRSSDRPQETGLISSFSRQSPILSLKPSANMVKAGQLYACPPGNAIHNAAREKRRTLLMQIRLWLWLGFRAVSIHPLRTDLILPFVFQQLTPGKADPPERFQCKH